MALVTKRNATGQVIYIDGIEKRGIIEPHAKFQVRNQNAFTPYSISLYCALQ